MITLLINVLAFLKAKTGKPAIKLEVETMTQAKVPKDFTEEGQLSYRPASGRSLLRHAGKWSGNDLQECLESVYATRGEAKFDDNNPFD